MPAPFAAVCMPGLSSGCGSATDLSGLVPDIIQKPVSDDEMPGGVDDAAAEGLAPAGVTRRRHLLPRGRQGSDRRTSHVSEKSAVTSSSSRFSLNPNECNRFGQVSEPHPVVRYEIPPAIPRSTSNSRPEPDRELASSVDIWVMVGLRRSGVP